MLCYVEEVIFLPLVFCLTTFGTNKIPISADEDSATVEFLVTVEAFHVLPPWINDGATVNGTRVVDRRVNRRGVDWRGVDQRGVDWRAIDGSAVDDGRRIIDPDTLLHPSGTSFGVRRRYAPTVAGPDRAGMHGDVVAFTVCQPATAGAEKANNRTTTNSEMRLFIRSTSKEMK